MKFIVILFLLFTSICTLAQQSDSQLAYTYYQAKEYDKAEEALKKLLKTDDNNKDFLIGLRYIYQRQGKTNKSERDYEQMMPLFQHHCSPGISDYATLPKARPLCTRFLDEEAFG